MTPSRLIALAAGLVLALPGAGGATVIDLPQLATIPSDLPAAPAAVLNERHYQLELLQKALLTEIPLNSAKCGTLDVNNTALRQECQADKGILRAKYTHYIEGVPILQRQINAVDVVAKQCRIARYAEEKNRDLLRQNKQSAEYIADHYTSVGHGDAILGHFGMALSHVELLLASFVKIDGNIAGLPPYLADSQTIAKLRQAGLGGLFPQGIPSGTAILGGAWTAGTMTVEMAACEKHLDGLKAEGGATARTVTALTCLAAIGKTAKFFESYGKGYELIAAEAEHFSQVADAIEIVKELYETKEAIMAAVDDPDGTPEGPAEAAKILGRHEEVLMTAIQQCEAKLMPALDQ